MRRLIICFTCLVFVLCSPKVSTTLDVQEDYVKVPAVDIDTLMLSCNEGIVSEGALFKLGEPFGDVPAAEGLIARSTKRSAARRQLLKATETQDRDRSRDNDVYDSLFFECTSRLRQALNDYDLNVDTVIVRDTVYVNAPVDTKQEIVLALLVIGIVICMVMLVAWMLYAIY